METPTSNMTKMTTPNTKKRSTQPAASTMTKKGGHAADALGRRYREQRPQRAIALKLMPCGPALEH